MNTQPMTVQQQQYQNRAKKVSTTLGANQTLVDSYDPLKAAQDFLNGNLALVPSVVSKKGLSTKGITIGKNELKDGVATLFSYMASVSRGYCITAHKTFEEGNLKKWTFNKLRKLADEEVLGVCKGIHDLIKDNLLPDAAFAPYGITALALTTALTMAKDFDNSLGGAGAADATISTATTTLEELIDEINGAVELCLLLSAHFYLSNPTFVADLKAAAVIDNIGVHHTGTQGKVTNKATGEAIAGAVIENLSSHRKAQSDLLGDYLHQPNRSGLRQFECTAPGFKKGSAVIALKRGKTLVWNWELEAED